MARHLTGLDAAERHCLLADLLVGVVRRHFCALLVFVYRRVAFGAGLGAAACAGEMMTAC
jgi:hypothetical protein